MVVANNVNNDVRITAIKSHMGGFWYIDTSIPNTNGNEKPEIVW
jgi:hypothetical protein